MKVKIRVERGWIEAPASATVSPELFVTPFVRERRGKNGRPYHYFSRRQFVVTHRRTGMTAMSDRVSKRMAIFAARLLGETGIPGKTERSNCALQEAVLPDQVGWRAGMGSSCAELPRLTADATSRLWCLGKTKALKVEGRGMPPTVERSERSLVR